MKIFTKNSVRKVSIPAILVGLFAILLFSAQNMATSVKAGTEGEISKIRVPIDIKPTSCPNPINFNNNGEISIAIAGLSKEQAVKVSEITGIKESFDVTTVKLESVRLVDVTSILKSETKEVVETKEVSPIREKIAFEDVATPYFPMDPRNELDCITSGRDGTTDVVFKFDAREVTASLQKAQDGELRALALIGDLNDGTKFVSFDLVRLNIQQKERIIIKPPTEGEKP